MKSKEKYENSSEKEENNLKNKENYENSSGKGENNLEAPTALLDGAGLWPGPPLRLNSVGNEDDVGDKDKDDHGGKDHQAGTT